MDIGVIKIRLLNSGKDLKGFADLQVDGWIFHDFRIVKQNGQRLSVLPPQTSWRDPLSGEIRFKGILTIPPEQKQRIDIEILAAFQREVERKNGKET